jgi:hypothetical protein
MRAAPPRDNEQTEGTPPPPRRDPGLGPDPEQARE